MHALVKVYSLRSSIVFQLSLSFLPALVNLADQGCQAIQLVLGDPKAPKVRQDHGPLSVHPGPEKSQAIKTIEIRSSELLSTEL